MASANNLTSRKLQLQNKHETKFCLVKFVLILVLFIVIVAANVDLRKDKVDDILANITD
jgi:hypothetical protein